MLINDEAPPNNKTLTDDQVSENIYNYEYLNRVLHACNIISKNLPMFRVLMSFYNTDLRS